MAWKKWAALALALSGTGVTAKADLVNPGLEFGQQPGTSNIVTSGSHGWSTTNPNGYIEIWGDGYGGVPAFEGNNFVELNVYDPSNVYQDVSGINAGAKIGFEFAHRGRLGIDTMQLTITDLGSDGKYGTSDDKDLFKQQYSDDNLSWGHYVNPDVNTAPITALGNTIRFTYTAISSFENNPSVGNFLDGAHVSFDVGNTADAGAATPLPSVAFGGLALIAGSRASRLLRRRRSA